MLPATSTESVVTIVGIRFRPAGRIYYFDPQGQAYTTGQYVIVETVRGTEAGRVVIAPKKLAESDLTDPLKPSKISGVCGRLLCCLSYENDNYVQAKQAMPQVGTMLNTPSGLGKVVSINVPKEYVEVMLESGVIIQVPANQQVEQKLSGNGGCGSCSANRANGGKCGSKCGGNGSCGCGSGCGTNGGSCGSCGVKRSASQN